MLPILQNKDYYSDFFLPNSDEKFYGKLAIRDRKIIGEFFSLPNELIKIKTEGSFVLDVPSDVDIIHCEFNDENDKRIRASLIFFKITRYRIGDIVRGIFHADLIAFGKYIDDLENLNTQNINIYIKYLYDWIDNKAVKASFKDGFKLYEKEIDYKCLYESDNKNISIGSDIHFSFQRESNVIREDVTLKLGGTAKVGLSKILDEIEDSRRIISLIFFDNSPIEWFSTQHDDEKTIWFRTDNRTYFERNQNYRLIIPFRFKSQAKYSCIFKNWVGKSETIELIGNKYFEVSHNLTLSHLAFQEYVNILERMSGFPESLHFWSRNVEAHLEKIKHITNSYNFFKAQLRKREKPTHLTVKLDSLLTGFNFIKEFVTDNPRVFAQKIAITRNWYTHPKAEKPKLVIPEND